MKRLGAVLTEIPEKKWKDGLWLARKRLILRGQLMLQHTLVREYQMELLVLLN